MKLEILLSGVGGQGIITMGSILGDICSRLGVNIVTAETHGMAQRMGSVEVFVRIGDVNAPLIPIGSADYLVALEMIEALRAIRYLKRCGWILLSDIYLPPPGAGKTLSRKEVIESLSRLPVKMLTIEADRIAKKLNDYRVVNIAMLGALLAFEDISKIIPISVAEDVVYKTLGEVNRQALILGYNQVLEKLRNGNHHISPQCLDQ